MITDKKNKINSNKSFGLVFVAVIMTDIVLVLVLVISLLLILVAGDDTDSQ